MGLFQLVTNLVPKGDQPQAIEKLTARIRENERFSTLLGVTGSGKTFTMAHVIQNVCKPTLVISHNKTLAAQLYAEFKAFFPKNAVHYFVSYYDYYQPEAYIPQKDIYIEKDSSINEDLDRLRLAATNALLSRKDVIIVASVSCIYNIGSPEDYLSISTRIKSGMNMSRDQLIKKLVDMQYERNDTDFTRGKFRVRGELVDLFPPYGLTPMRIEFNEDSILSIHEMDPFNWNSMKEYDETRLYPAKYFITPEDRIKTSLASIEEELGLRLEELKSHGKLVEAQRLDARTRYDMEMLSEVGYCKGIENYSRYLSGRKHGDRPHCLIDYFPKDFLCIVDESHATLPQLRGMYNGDRSRKQTLVEYGFRLPSCLDNRPITFDEWLGVVTQVMFISATPGPFELEKTKQAVEQIIRPTGLVDPQITVHPSSGQMQDILARTAERVKRNERVLVTTLTKRLAEELASYLQEQHVRCRYLHSEIETFDRVKILRELREGKFDVLVGVNLLREGLDLPEVSLVAILDADKEGFLRSETSIIQTVGRTARNVNGEVVLYADQITKSMERAITETSRRRKLQLEYNKANNITPVTIQKEIKKGIEEILDADKIVSTTANLSDDEYRRNEVINELERQMYEYAGTLDFEKAAQIRDTISKLAGDEYLKNKENKIKFKVIETKTFN